MGVYGNGNEISRYAVNHDSSGGVVADCYDGKIHGIFSLGNALRHERYYDGGAVWQRRKFCVYKRRVINDTLYLDFAVIVFIDERACIKESTPARRVF